MSTAVVPQPDFKDAAAQPFRQQNPDKFMDFGANLLNGKVEIDSFLRNEVFGDVSIFSMDRNPGV